MRISTENQYSDVKDILEHLKDLPNKEFTELVVKADVTIRSKAWNDKKISAHHAIIPTRVKADFAKLTSIEQNLYLMVAQAYLAQFYPVHEYKATTVIITFADEKFIGKGKLVTNKEKFFCAHNGHITGEKITKVAFERSFYNGF